MSYSGLLHRIERLRGKLRESTASNAYAKYRFDPVGYARDVLKVEWWAKQVEIAEALLKPPYKVLVKASHSVGKSHLIGGIVNWWYDTRDPGVCLTTAPTARQVRDIIWKEVRRQRRGRKGFTGPKMPRLESSPMHFAMGLTADTSTSFQGQHEEAVLIILDEAVGVDRAIWEGADSMVMGASYAILALCNPTDTGSEFYSRESQGGWHVIHIPCLEHPNIAAELAGEEAPYPSAVRLAWLEDRLEQWTEQVTSLPLPTDIEWPPGSGKYLRPGPLAEARLLGRWPSSAAGVWSDTLWGRVETIELPLTGVLSIGCDVARFGDDNTEIHVRYGSVSLHHESHNGWGTNETAGRLKQLCNEWAAWLTSRQHPGEDAFDPKKIPVNIDDDGVGGGVVDQRDGYDFRAVGSGCKATAPDDYPNVRSELWFALAARAKLGRLSLSRLPTGIRRELKRQAVAPLYKLDGAGRRVVEPKDVTKKKIGRSPDGMDAMNLAYYEGGRSFGVAEWVDTGERRSRNRFK